MSTENAGLAKNHAGMAHVVKLEEKRSDVNLTVTALVDAMRSDADCFVLVTGDSDQAITVYAFRHEFGKSMLVFKPTWLSPNILNGRQPTMRTFLAT